MTVVDRALVTSFSAVVLAFVGSTIYSEVRAERIEEDALEIQGNAAPSVRHLAIARAELRRLQLLVHRALEDGSSPRPSLVEIGAARSLLDDELADYQRLPMYPGENEAWQRTRAAIARLDTDLDAILGGLHQGDMVAARAAQFDLDAVAEVVADSLSRGIDINVAAAAGAAANIRMARKRGVWWAVGLDGAGTILAGFAAFLSVRAARGHARAIRSYQHVAEERAAELDKFASRMAHDVRTPLTALALSLTAIERAGLEDKRAYRALGRAQAALSQTMKIIEGLLDFARSGARPEMTAPVSVFDVANQVSTVMHPRAEQAGAAVILGASSRSTVACSDGALSSVLSNLVGNALTYVEGAAVRNVTIDIVDQGQEVLTQVSDTGPGLPPNSNIESLFDPYVRGSNARGKGLGLGLATVKRIVEAHRGRVGARSTPRGCTFWFALPRQPEAHLPA